MVSLFVLLFLFQLISLLQIRKFLLQLKRCILTHTKEINKAFCFRSQLQSIYSLSLLT